MYLLFAALRLEINDRSQNLQLNVTFDYFNAAQRHSEVFQAATQHCHITSSLTRHLTDMMNLKCLRDVGNFLSTRWRQYQRRDG